MLPTRSSRTTNTGDLTSVSGLPRSVYRFTAVDWTGTIKPPASVPNLFATREAHGTAAGPDCSAAGFMGPSCCRRGLGPTQARHMSQTANVIGGPTAVGVSPPADAIGGFVSDPASEPRRPNSTVFARRATSPAAAGDRPTVGSLPPTGPAPPASTRLVAPTPAPRPSAPPRTFAQSRPRRPRRVPPVVGGEPFDPHVGQQRVVDPCTNQISPAINQVAVASAMSRSRDIGPRSAGPSIT